MKQNKLIQTGREYWAWADGSQPVNEVILAGVQRFVERFKFYPRTVFVNTEVLRGGVQAPVGIVLKPDDGINKATFWFEVGK